MVLAQLLNIVPTGSLVCGVSLAQGSRALNRAGIRPQGCEFAFETQEDRQVNIAARASDDACNDLKGALDFGYRDCCILHVVRASAGLIAADTLNRTGGKLRDRPSRRVPLRHRCYGCTNSSGRTH